MAKSGKTLVKKIFIKGKITLLTGLHIGGTNTQLEIGGIDANVIRNPFNNDEPYIPGSSLKGKMRSLLEQTYGDFGKGAGHNVKYGPVDDIDHPVVKLFGAAKGDDKNIPSRILVRDCSILSEDIENSDLPFTEVKTEVMIDRITASAQPRQLERVPAGVEFDLQIVLNVWNNHRFEENKEEHEEEKLELTEELSESEMINMLMNAFRLLESDYLGGKGSRGSGQVKIGLLSIQERNREYYTNIETLNTDDYDNSIHAIPEDLKYHEFASH